MSGASRVTPPRRPRSWATFLATLGPLGKLPAPGTFGSAAGAAAFYAVGRQWPLFGQLLLSLALASVAIWVCSRAERELGKKDPGEIVLDEAAAMPTCFVGWASLTSVFPEWGVWVGGFALFRLFDIAKPFGIRRLQALPGGWGVVTDDFAAAFLTCGCLHAAAALAIAWT